MEVKVEQFGLVFFYGITAFDDIRTKQIRTIELIVFAVIGVIQNIFSKSQSLLSIIGGVGIGAVFVIFSILSKEKLGMGDALIIAVTGIYLGLMDTVVRVWLSTIFAAAYGLIKLRKCDNKDLEMPFVPFMLLAYTFMLLIHHIGGLIV